LSALGELIVRIAADARDLTRGLNDSTRRMNRWARDAEKSMGPVMNAIGAGMKIVGAAAVTGFAAAITSGVKLNASLEQSKVAFTTLLGSAEKADAFLREMRDFAEKTPFEFAGLQESAKKLLAFGFTAQQIKPMLTAVGDAVAALGGGQEMIDRVTMALGQMQAKQKVSGDEMLQLTEAGIPAWQMLADKMGLTTAEVMGLSEKGLIPADQAIQALTEGMEIRFGGMMEKQSQTMLGLFSTLKDTAAGVLTTISGPVFEIIKGNLDALMVKINEWKSNGSLQAWADQAGASLSAFWGIAEKIFNSLVAVGKFIADNWGLISPILAGILAGYLAFQVITGILNAIKIAQAALNVVMAANPITLVVLAIAALVAAGVLLYQNWDKIKEAGGKLAEFISQKWEDLKTATITTWEKVKTFIAEAFKFIYDKGQFFQDLYDKIFNIWSKVTETTNTTWNTIKNFLNTTFGDIKKDVVGTWNDIFTAIDTVITNVKNGFNGLVEDAKEWGSNLLKNFIEGITSMFDSLKNTVTNAIGIVADHLGFHSPTKLGPGRDADKWAPNFVKMFAEGLQVNLPQISKASTKFASDLVTPINLSNPEAISAVGSGGNVFNITINGSNADEIWNQLERKLHRYGVRW